MSSPPYPVLQASFIVGLVKGASQGKSPSTMLESSPPCSGKGWGLELRQVPAAVLRSPQGPIPSELHDPREGAEKDADRKRGGGFCRRAWALPTEDHREGS